MFVCKSFLILPLSNWYLTAQQHPAVCDTLYWDSCRNWLNMAQLPLEYFSPDATGHTYSRKYVV